MSTEVRLLEYDYKDVYHISTADKYASKNGRIIHFTKANENQPTLSITCKEICVELIKDFRKQIDVCLIGVKTLTINGVVEKFKQAIDCILTISFNDTELGFLNRGYEMDRFVNILESQYVKIK